MFAVLSDFSNGLTKKCSESRFALAKKLTRALWLGPCAPCMGCNAGTFVAFSMANYIRPQFDPVDLSAITDRDQLHDALDDAAAQFRTFIRTNLRPAQLTWANNVYAANNATDIEKMQAAAVLRNRNPPFTPYERENDAHDVILASAPLLYTYMSHARLQEHLQKRAFALATAPSALVSTSRESSLVAPTPPPSLPSRIASARWSATSSTSSIPSQPLTIAVQRSISDTGSPFPTRPASQPREASFITASKASARTSRITLSPPATTMLVPTSTSTS